MKKNTDFSIDYYAPYDPIFDPPEDFLEECRQFWANRSPFNGIIEKRIGNTTYVVETSCEGAEPLDGKLHRMIFAEKGGISP